jgi:FAD:protein FMN transferase
VSKTGTIGILIPTLVFGVVAMRHSAASQEFAEPVAFEHPAMGTRFEIIVYRPGGMSGAALQEAVAEAFRTIDDLEAKISTWRSTSQTTHVNKNAHRMPIQVSADVMDLLLYCQDLHRRTGGAFDITLGPLLEVYGYYWGQGRRPPRHSFEEARAKVGMQYVKLDAESRTVKLERPGMRLDFGGVGKGLALDLAAAALRDRGIAIARLDSGKSTILAMGAPPGTDGWNVTLKDPYNEEVAVDSVVLCDESLSTSACYNDFEDLEGGAMCDVVDPRSGLPVTGVLSVTVVARTGIETDALSTAFVVMGHDAVAAYCREQEGVRAIFVPEPNPGDKPRPIRLGFDAQEDSK